MLLDGDLTLTWHRCLLSNPAFIQYYNQNATSWVKLWRAAFALISKVGSLPLLFRQLTFPNVFQSDYSQSKLDNDRLETGCYPPDSMQLQTDHQFFEITWRSAVRVCSADNAIGLQNDQSVWQKLLLVRLKTRALEEHMNPHQKCNELLLCLEGFS